MIQSVWFRGLGALLLLVGMQQALIAASQDLEFGGRGEEINKITSKSPEKMQTALKTISVETGVPLDDVKAQHKRYAQTGIAGLLLANVLAAETKKEPEAFLRARTSGKSWGEIARGNKVAPEKLEKRLENLLRMLKS